MKSKGRILLPILMLWIEPYSASIPIEMQSKTLLSVSKGDNLE